MNTDEIKIRFRILNSKFNDKSYHVRLSKKAGESLLQIELEAPPATTAD